MLKDGTSENNKRGKLDETLCAMFANENYTGDYLFYAHILGQCSIKIREKFGGCAGVSFVHDHYNLYINPNDIWTPIEKLKGVKRADVPKKDIKTEDGEILVRTFNGFDSYSLDERLAILKHETLHILYGHVNRRESRKPLLFNYATDCALNQHINSNHLPEGSIVPKTLKNMFGLDKVPENESAEHYYELLMQSNESNKPNEPEDGEDGEDGNGSPQDGEDGNGSPQDGEDDGHQQPGSHNNWEESKGDKDLQRDLTKKMIERASELTEITIGEVPEECSDWLDLHSHKPEIKWQKVLRGIVGNKRVGYRTTVMRRDRRFPNREDLRGRTKKRTYDLLVVCDVSGSMSDKDIVQTLGEVRGICDLTKSHVDLIQIDTVAYSPEKLTKKTNVVVRKGCGGTDIHPALQKAKEHKIDYQAVVVLTDGYLTTEDVGKFEDLKKRIIWLITPDGNVMSEMDTRRMKSFKLKGV